MTFPSFSTTADRQQISDEDSHRSVLVSHEAAADFRFERMHHERDYPGMFLDHSGYQEILLVKSDMHVLGQEAHQVPQGCPMGPKILVQKFSHTTLK